MAVTASLVMKAATLGKQTWLRLLLDAMPWILSIGTHGDIFFLQSGGGFSLVGSVTSRDSCNGVFGRRHSCLSWHQLQPGPSSQAFKTKEGWNSGMPWQSRGLVLRAMGETLWELQALLVKNLREEAAPSKHKGWAFTNSIQPLTAMSIPRLE